MKRLPHVALTRLLPAALVGIYLLLLRDGGWLMDRYSGVLHVGGVSPESLERFGASIPSRVQGGEWHRLLLDAWLAPTLLSLVLGTVFLLGVLREARQAFGAGALFAWMVLTGAAAAGADAVAREGALLALGQGCFPWVLGLSGAQLALGLFGGSHPRRIPARRAALTTLVMIALFHVGLTWEARTRFGLEADFGDQALLAAVAVGFLLGLLARPARQRPPGRPGGVLGVAAVLLLGVAVVQQVVQAGADQGRPAVRSLLDDVLALEHAARDVWEQGAATPPEARSDLRDLRARVRSTSLDRLSDERRVPLFAYLEAMEPLVVGEVPDPSGVRVRLRKAAEAWYEAGEAPLRAEVGLVPKPPHEERTWGPR